MNGLNVLNAALALTLLFASAVHAAIVGDTAATATIDRDGSTQTATISKAVSGANRFMIIGVAIRSLSISVSSVVYNGSENATLIKRKTNADDAISVELWGLIAPTVGTNNVVVTLSAADISFVASVVVYTGVHQTTPTGTAVDAEGDSTDPSVVASSAAGEVVVDMTAKNDATSFPSAPTLTVGAGQTQKANLTTTEGGGNDLAGAMSEEAGAASVTMSWSGNNNPWAIAAVPLKPAGASSEDVDEIAMEF